MTARELYEYYEVQADESGQNALTPVQFSLLYELARHDWLNNECKQANSETTRAKLRPFTFPAKFTTDTFDLRNVPTKPFMRLRAMRADFGPNWTNMPVKPSESDQQAEIENDPFRQPTNDEPRFSEVGYIVTVKGETTPTEIRIEYVAEPPKLDMGSDATVWETLDQFNEILARLMAKQYLRDQNTNQYQAWAAREVPASEQNNPA